MYTNAGMDMVALAAEQESRRMSHEFDEAHAAAERRAMLQADGSTLTAPEIVLPGSPAHVRREFSYENDPGKEKREVSRIRAAYKGGRGHLQPRQIVDHGNHVELVYDGEHPIKAFAEKLFCIRCRDARSDTEHEQRERHERLKASVPYPYEIPENIMDHCGTCGARLGGQQEVA